MKFQFRMRWASSTPIEVEIAAEFEGRGYIEQAKEAIRVVLEKHRKWRNGEEGGSRANLSRAYLSGANLSGADLSGADLSRADLSRANLSDADLSDANLSRANLSDANLSDADLSDADLSDAKIIDKAGNVITVTRAPLILSGLDYRVIIWGAHMQIGCEMHSLADWRGFGDRDIAAMDGARARRFWGRHKAALLALAESDGRGVETEAATDASEAA